VEDLGPPSSYLTLESGLPVLSRDGGRLGEVEHVLADPDADVFDGIVVDASEALGGHRFVDAPEVAEIYERGVVLALDASAAAQLPEPSENPPTLGVHPDDTAEGELQRKLRRAWERMSGKR
jgi:hypothetical protein